MKKLLLLSFALVAILFAANSANSQTLYFCEGVDSDGYPITSSKTFNISSSGGYLYALVRMPYAIGCRSVRLEIYRDGSYDNTIYIDTENDWTWFWKKITFYKNGNYSFDVYDCYDYLLTSGSVRINYK